MWFFICRFWILPMLANRKSSVPNSIAWKSYLLSFAETVQTSLPWILSKWPGICFWRLFWDWFPVSFLVLFIRTEFSGRIARELHTKEKWRKRGGKVQKLSVLPQHTNHKPGVALCLQRLNKTMHCYKEI